MSIYIDVLKMRTGMKRELPFQVREEITWGKSLQIYQLVPKIYCEKIADIRMRAP